MKITTAISFDNKKHKEVFKTITISQASAKKLIESYLDGLDYGPRQNFIDEYAVKKKKYSRYNTPRTYADA
jgi:hypothetical protein